MAVVLHPQGIGTLANPFYVADRVGDARPTPAADDATLFVLETRETYIWHGGTWNLSSTPATAAALIVPLLTAVACSNLKILRELRLLRAGMVEASTCKDLAAETDLDADEQPI